VEFEKHFQNEWQAWLASDCGAAQFLQWQQEQEGRRTLDKIKQMTEKAEKETNPKKKEQLLGKVPDLYESFKKSYKDVYFAKTSPLGTECGKMLEDWEAAAESKAPEESEVYRLWQKMTSWVLDGFWATYSRLGISFDSVDYESQTYSLGKSICEEALASGIFHRNATGAVAVSYEKMPSLKLQGEKILLRSNGTSVYMTQDLGTAMTRWDRHGANKMVYVVADEQKEHFRILFELLSLLQPNMQGAFHHLSYGMVNLTTGRMKSREGTVVDADNLLDEVQELATNSTKGKYAAALEKAKTKAASSGVEAVGDDDEDDEFDLSEEEIQTRGKCIGLAALKFYILNSPPQSTMLYSPSESIKFEGQTGPYILYCYARTRSVLRNASVDGAAVLQSGMPCLDTLGTTAEETAVLKCLFSFNDSLLQAAKTHNPAKVCHAVFDLAQSFNKLFNQKAKHPIVNCTEPDLRTARLLMTEAVGVALRKGLALLGISVLERM
jgi:arginyl-tRNA synthetase